MTRGPLPEWQDDALCAQVGQEFFFPEKGENWHVRQAKKLCAACPVRSECLQFAIDNGEQYGIWGGLSYLQRLKVNRGAA